MPTADEFSAFAASLGDAAVEVGAERSRVERASSGAVVGGTVADRVGRMLDELAVALARVDERLHAVAEEARRRAVRCREYSAAMAEYRAELTRWEAATAALPWLPSADRPVPPTRPGPWAEES